jgi:SAM-dependent methyltransferase
VSDERYLLEERGRRRTSRRLLDLVGRYVASGRLLQVGCGYGLLLDEARKRGYDVEGVEVATRPARYARERLGLPVREMPIEDADMRDARYDAILLVDVIEHLDDPVLVLDRLLAALAPDGVLLIVTPDPSSPVARLVSRRWWCYVPAHACLIPRASLRGLLQDRGLAVLEDRWSVHSFSLSYWLAGLSERAGWAGRAITALAARLPSSVMLTASLKDERVFLARAVHSEMPARRYASSV